MSAKPFPCQLSKAQHNTTSCWARYIFAVGQNHLLGWFTKKILDFALPTWEGQPWAGLHQKQAKKKSSHKWTPVNILKSPHISLSAGGTSATHNLLVSKYQDRFLHVSTFLFTLTPPPPSHPLQGRSAGAAEFELQDIDNFHSISDRPAPHSSAPPRLLPRHLVWLQQPTS